MDDRTNKKRDNNNNNNKLYFVQRHMREIFTIMFVQK